MEYIALYERAQQVAPDKWDTWTEAYEIGPDETVSSVFERIKKRTMYPSIEQVRIVSVVGRED